MISQTLFSSRTIHTPHGGYFLKSSFLLILSQFLKTAHEKVLAAYIIWGYTFRFSARTSIFILTKPDLLLNAELIIAAKSPDFRSRLISVEYVTSLGLLRQYQMYVSLYVCMQICISPLLPRFQVIEIEAISCFVQKVTVSRAKMLKASEGCTNSYN